jgi:hypothetical protein
MEQVGNFSVRNRPFRRQRAEDVAGFARYLALEASASEDPARLAAELRDWADADPAVLGLALRYEDAEQGHPERAVQLLSDATRATRAA